MLTVSYEDYETHYSTGSFSQIPQRYFPSYLAKAEAFLSSLTMGKISKESSSENLLRCACEIAELFYKQAQNRGIRGENNDGYSVSYSDFAVERAVTEIAETYLASTGLLYRGIG